MCALLRKACAMLSHTLHLATTIFPKLMELIFHHWSIQRRGNCRDLHLQCLVKVLDTGPIVQGAVRIDGELVLKRFVARNVKAITPIAWNPTIGDQLFAALDGQGPGEPLPVQPGVHVEPAAPDVQRPQLPESGAMQPIPEADVVEYPDGAHLVRDMKKADPSFRAPLPRKRQSESAPSQSRKPGELKTVHCPPRDLQCLHLRLPRVQDPR